jgi:hypothetical protein
MGFSPKYCIYRAKAHKNYFFYPHTKVRGNKKIRTLLNNTVSGGEYNAGINFNTLVDTNRSKIPF